jgi:uncharacterized iron-regulated membrane protein
MKWFRSNVKGGARLALFALAVQFTLSFGHFHWLAATQAAPVVQSNLTQADTADVKGLAAASGHATPQQSPADHDGDQQPADNCAICAVVAMASTVLLATPPLLLLPQVVEFLYLTTDAEFVHLKSAGVAFQPRAPPAS